MWRARGAVGPIGQLAATAFRSGQAASESRVRRAGGPARSTCAFNGTVPPYTTPSAARDPACRARVGIGTSAAARVTSWTIRRADAGVPSVATRMVVPSAAHARELSSTTTRMPEAPSLVARVGGDVAAPARAAPPYRPLLVLIEVEQRLAVERPPRRPRPSPRPQPSVPSCEAVDRKADIGLAVGAVRGRNAFEAKRAPDIEGAEGGLIVIAIVVVPGAGSVMRHVPRSLSWAPLLRGPHPEFRGRLRPRGQSPAAKRSAPANARSRRDPGCPRRSREAVREAGSRPGRQAPRPDRSGAARRRSDRRQAP